MNIKDIAKEAGVSISTVSRVINGTAKVNDDTRIRVEAAIERHNYRPNALARNLLQKKTNTIGVLISVQQLNMSSISETINAISDVLNGSGYRIMLANSRFQSDEEINFFHVFQEKRVDGILYFASGFTANHLETLKDYPIPIVTIGQQLPQLNLPHVIHDDYYAAYTATEYLIRQGHRDIAYIACPSYDESAGNVRRSGYENALRAYDIPVQNDYIVQGDFTMESGYKAAEDLINNNQKRPTAIFGSTDYMAIGAIRYLLDQGIQIPEQVSVMGFDDVNIAKFFNPRLTTIHTDKVSVGRVAANTLLKIMNDESLDVKKYVADYNLIERESVRKI